MNLISSSKIFGLSLISFALLITGCDKVEVSLNAPETEPPVRSATPPILLASVVSGKPNNRIVSRTSDDFVKEGAEKDLGTIKDRFFGGVEGGTNILGQLKSIDDRLNSLESRSNEDQRACLLDATVTSTLAASLPTTETIPLEIQCIENITNTVSETVSVGGTLQLAFGSKDGNFYLTEIQSNDDFTSMAVVVNADESGDDVETWFIGSRQTGFDPSGVEETFTEDKGLFVHVIANSTSKTLELSVGGDDVGNGVGCGVQLRTNGSLIYASGVFYDNYNSNCTARTPVTYCISTDSFTELPVSDCETAGIDSFTLEKIDYTTAGLAASAKTISTTLFTGFKDFNE